MACSRRPCLQLAGKEVRKPLTSSAPGGPALNQLANISDKRESDAVRKPRLSLKKRSAAAGLAGLTAASLLATPQAEAATEAFQLAAGGWHPIFPICFWSRHKDFHKYCSLALCRTQSNLTNHNVSCGDLLKGWGGYYFRRQKVLRLSRKWQKVAPRGSLRIMQISAHARKGFAYARTYNSI